MERPVKRQRLRGPEDLGAEVIFANEAVKAVDIDRPQLSQTSSLKRTTAAIPTRTVDLSAFRRRMLAANDQQSRNQRRGHGIYLLPREPEVTATKLVINVAIEDGSSSASTMVDAPITNSALDIPNMGTLTIPGVSQITDAAASLVTEASGVVTEISGQLLPTLLSDNGTISALASVTGEQTTTVTATSTFEVTFSNGTFLAAASRTNATTSQSNPSSNSDSFATISTSKHYFGATMSMPSSSAIATSNNAIAGAGAGATASSTGSSSAEASTAGSGGGGGGGGVTLTPQQQQVVGGVVGGVAGIAFVIAALLYFWRWYRKHSAAHRGLTEPFTAVRSITNDHGDDRLLANRPEMMETRPDRTSSGITALANRLRTLRPNSTLTTSTSSENTRASTLIVPSSERGFQRIAGRKIPPALSSGGDGYGGVLDVFEPDTPSPPRGARKSTRHRRSLSDSEPTLSSAGPALTGDDPFADPPRHQRGSSTSTAGTVTVSRDFGTSYVNRNRHSTNVRATPVFHSNRNMEGYAALRPSPARTPTAQSPTIMHAGLHEPMSTPPLMTEEVPDLPAIPALSLPPKRNSDRSGRSSSARDSNSARISTRSSGTVRSVAQIGRFREDIA